MPPTIRPILFFLGETSRTQCRIADKKGGPMKKTLSLIALHGLVLLGCASEKGYLFAPGRWQQKYTPPAELTHFSDGVFDITVESLGANPSVFFADLVVRNSSAEAAVFDPALFELKVVDTGITYFHFSKDKTSVEVPASNRHFLLPVTLKPGQATKGSLLFEVAANEAHAQAVELSYHGVMYRYPPHVQSASSDPH